MVYSDCGIPVYFGLNLDDCEYIDPIVFNNFPPIADAGDDQLVEFGTTVILDGSNSNDPDGSIDSFVVTDHRPTCCHRFSYSGYNLFCFTK